MASATEQEVREIVDWIKLDPDLQLWWDNEFAQTDGNITPELKDKLFEKIREKTALLEDEDSLLLLEDANSFLCMCGAGSPLFACLYVLLSLRTILCLLLIVLCSHRIQLKPKREIELPWNCQTAHVSY
jgi:hypothetical protein